MATKKTLTPIKDREKNLVSIKDRYPKKSALTDIKEREKNLVPIKNKNKSKSELTSIKNKSTSTGKRVATKLKKKSGGATNTITGTGTDKLKNKLY